MATSLFLCACNGAEPIAVTRPVQEAVASPTPSLSPTALPTETPSAVSTAPSSLVTPDVPSPASPTPTPTPSKDTVCLDDTPLAVDPPSGALRVVYESGDAIWQWRAESEEATRLFDLGTLPDDVIGHQVSVDGRYLAYLRRPDDATYELWVQPHRGEAYQIDTLDTTALQEEHPYANGIDLIYRWVHDSPLLLYRLDPRVQGVPAFYEAVYLANGETGQSRRIFPAGEISSLTFSPAMDQIAATAADEVRLLDRRTGQVQHAIPLPLRRGAYSWLRYSPDGQTIAALTRQGISLIDTDNGSHQDASLDYELVGVSHYSLVPPRFWSPDGRYLYTSIAAGDDFSDISDPDGRFTVWRVDAGDARATALKEFGGFMSSFFSPGARYLAFERWLQSIRQFYLADLGGGPPFLYDYGRSLFFDGWNPDGVRFLYHLTGSGDVKLGHVCDKPQTLEAISPAVEVAWIDTGRILALGALSVGDGRPLQLYTLDGTHTVIAPLTGDDPPYHFYFDENERR